MVEWLPEVATQAHWLDVVDDFGNPPALHTQRRQRKEGAPVLPPLGGVIAWLLVSPGVHRLALGWVGHARHQRAAIIRSMTIQPM